MVRFVIIGLLLLLPMKALSQPPAPTSLKKGDTPHQKTTNKNEAAENLPNGTQDHPIFIDIIKTQLDRNDKDEERQYRNAESTKNWWIMFFTGGLLIVAAGQALLFLHQLKLMRKSIDDTETTAKAALQAVQTSQQTGRAYVKITSCSPGVRFHNGSPALPSGFSCDLKITNHGETPAQITDIVIHYKILDGLQLLPDVPDYGSAKKYRFSHAFLVRGESISYNFSEYISDDTIIDLQVGNKILSIYGYVDYIDAFNRSHRGGFGQNYYYFNDNRNHYTDDVAYIHRNNLTFLMQADYNFDRPRTDNTESTA